MKPSLRAASHAFTLIEMAVVLVIIGLMSGLILQSERAARPSNCYAQTESQLATINSAIDTFVRNNNRYPLPAGRSLGVTNPKFGHETAAPDIATDIDTVNGNLYFGALPFQALGLPDAYAADCWGNKFSYVVTVALTSDTNFLSPNIDGAIKVKSGPIASSVTLYTTMAYAVISHGETGVGAVAKNYTGAAHGWCGVASAIDSENCDLTNDTLYAATFNNGRNAGDLFFDDLIAFTGKKNSNCNGASYPVSWGGLGACQATINVSMNNNEIINPVNNTAFGHTGTAAARCVNGTVVLDASVPAICDGCEEDPMNPGTCAASCMDGVVQWGGGNCSATFTSVANSAVTPLTDNASAGYVGSAKARCSSGAWVIEPGEICNVDNSVSCPAGVQSWNTDCSGNFPLTADGGSSGAVTNKAAGFTGSATGTCSAGVWNITGSCNPAPPPCTGGILNWGGNCLGTFPTTEDGASSPAAANTNHGYTGSATATCSGSVWSAPSGNCDPLPPTDCSDRMLSWGASCKTIFTHTASGATVGGRPNTTPGFTGTASATCTNGTWSAAGGSCSPIGPSTCQSATLTWNTNCSGVFPSQMHNGTTPAVANTASGYSGTATATCSNGSWQPIVGGSCAAVPAGNCPIADLSWGTNCSARFNGAVNGATTGAANNTASGYTGSAQATCSNGSWSIAGGATCSALPAPVYCGQTGGCGNGGNGFTFYNDAVAVYCQPGKCASTPNYTQYWDCGGNAGAGNKTYTNFYCAP